MLILLLRELLLAAILLEVSGSEAAPSDSSPQRDPQAPARERCRRDAKDEKWGSLCGWLLDTCGAIGVEDIFSGSFTHGGNLSVRGIGAARAFEAGENLLCIPRKCWFTNLVEEPGLQNEQVQSCGADVALAVQLAVETAKGNESFWAPYLNILPKLSEYSAFHPSFLHGKEAPSFKNSWRRWVEPTLECIDEYKETHPEVNVSYDDMHVAITQLYTRRFGDVDMVPLADMSNTKRDADLNVGAEYLDGQMSAFCLQARRPIEAGEELLVDYGSSGHDAVTMFVLYGFALPSQYHMAVAKSDGGEVASGLCEGLMPQDITGWPTPKTGPAQNLLNFANTHCATSEARAGRDSRFLKLEQELRDTRGALTLTEEDLKRAHQELREAREELATALEDAKRLRTLSAAGVGAVLCVAWFGAMFYFSTRPSSQDDCKGAVPTLWSSSRGPGKSSAATAKPAKTKAAAKPMTQEAPTTDVPSQEPPASHEAELRRR